MCEEESYTQEDVNVPNEFWIQHRQISLIFSFDSSSITHNVGLSVYKSVGGSVLNEIYICMYVVVSVQIIVWILFMQYLAVVVCIVHTKGVNYDYIIAYKFVTCNIA